jgi:hypothetical protein
MSTLVSSTNNLVGPLFFLEAFGFLEATGIGARLLGSGLEGASSEGCSGAKFRGWSSNCFFAEDFLADASSLLKGGGGGADIFSNLAMFFVASRDARCVGAGGSGINQGLSRNVKSVDAKKKPP